MADARDIDETLTFVVRIAFGTIGNADRLVGDADLIGNFLEDEDMRAYALLAVSALLLAAGCAKKDDNADMTTPPADTAPTTPMPAEPAPSPTPSETPPPPDTTDSTTTPPADTGTTPPPPAQ